MEPTDKQPERLYQLTDANGELIEGEEYDNPDDALDARAVLMSSHPDGDDVTVEVVDT